MFLKSQQLVAAGDCMKLSFINKQKLTCLWPENLQVMRPTLETCQGRSRRVIATVGVISGEAVDPKPARGGSSVLVTELASLVTVQMTAALVKDISPPVESQVSSQIGCWPPECLWSWEGRVGGGGREVRGDLNEDRPGVGWGCADCRATPGQDLSFLENPGSWPAPDPICTMKLADWCLLHTDEMADSPEEEGKRERGRERERNLGPLWMRIGYPAVTC